MEFVWLSKCLSRNGHETSKKVAVAARNTIEKASSGINIKYDIV